VDPKQWIAELKTKRGAARALHLRGLDLVLAEATEEEKAALLEALGAHLARRKLGPRWGALPP
jgi:cysteine synthase